MVSYTITQHAVAFPSKLLASEGGAHIYNVQLTANMDNGTIIGRGAYLSLDLYEQAAAPNGFTAVIREKAPNGNWRVEVTANPNHALLVYSIPEIAEDWTNKWKKYSNFYNAQGDQTRAYDLCVGDMFEVSAEGFSGTPVAGKTLTVSSASATLGKLVVAA